MKLQNTILRAAAFTLVAILAPACQSRPAGPVAPAAAHLAEQAPAVDRSAPSLQALRNATYSGVTEAGAPFTLVGGTWEGRPFSPGGASRPRVTFVRDFRLVADLDGDGEEEAVVLLAANAGGTGELLYLAVVGRSAGTLANKATTLVGDRVQVREATVDGRRIVINTVQAGENDAACCPGDLVTRTWDLSGAALKEAALVKTGRLSLDTLAGSEWVLTWWAWDEAVPATSEVTLTLDGSRLVGTAGCNNYFAPVKSGDAPGDVSLGPAGTTRKMCPGPVMAVETRFLRQLNGVTQVRFVAGQLALTYAKADRTFGVMLFDRRAAR